MTQSTQPPQEGASAAEVTAVTREHRIAALVAFGLGDIVGTKNQVAAWVEDASADHGLFSDMLPMVAQALADAEARSRASRDAELERVKRELVEANAGLAQYAADIEGLGVPDAPWPETLEAIKAAMRIEKGAIVTDEQLGPTYFASNHEAGDGQTMCSLCDEEVEEAHALAVCVANLRSEREAYCAGLGRAGESATVTDEQLAAIGEAVEDGCDAGEGAEKLMRRITAALAARGVK